jgi:hypothetical protein
MPGATIKVISIVLLATLRRVIGDRTHCPRKLEISKFDSGKLAEKIPANTGNRISVLQRTDVSKTELTQLIGLLVKENK